MDASLRTVLSVGHDVLPAFSVRSRRQTHKVVILSLLTPEALGVPQIQFVHHHSHAHSLSWFLHSGLEWTSRLRIRIHVDNPVLVDDVILVLGHFKHPAS